MLHIGIDIGHDHLKVVGIRRLLGRARLIGANAVPIPTGTVTRTGLDHRAELLSALRLALRTARPHPLPGGRVTSALPAGSSLTKLLELPAMNAAELDRSIPLEASQAFPVPTEDLVIDWSIIRPASHPAWLADRRTVTPSANPAPPPPTGTDVLLIAAPKSLVLAMTDLFTELGLELAALEIKPFANVRATAPAHEPGTTLVVDIGAADSSLVVTTDGQIRHVTTIAFGANAIAKPTVSPKESGKRSRTKTTDKLGSPPALDLLAPQLAPLAEEITHVAKFAEQRLRGGERIRRVRLCGGGATIARLPTTLGRLVEAPVELGNPLLHLPDTVLSPSDALPLTTAIGLSLRQEVQ